MKAIILVAGYATRLYPLTKNTPKPLLEVGGKAIINYIVEQINTVSAVDEIYVVSNHKFAANFEAWAEKLNNPVPITVLDDGTSTEETRRGAIGDILFTIQEKNIDDDLMIIAGDNLFTYSLNEYYNYFVEKADDCVCVKQFDDMEMIKQLGVVLLDENNQILDFEEKPENPKSNKAAFATYIYKKSTVPMFKEYLEAGNKPDAPGNFLAWLYKKKNVFAYVMNGECYDIGTHKALDEVNRIFS
jgi:glucose-1-phosphate thymidylyltransferase